MSDLQVGIIAAVAALAVILTWHAATRDKEVRRTRWGIFIERDRYSEVDEVETHSIIPWPMREPNALDAPTQELREQDK